MNNILLLYETVSGSTKEIAGYIYDNLKNSTCSISILPVNEVTDISLYDIIIIGGPSRFGGFASKLNRFIKKNSLILRSKKIIFFHTCLYIIKSKEDILPDVGLYIDPSFNIIVKSNKDMDTMDKKHRLSHYLKLLLNICPDVKPIEIAFFNGVLDLSKLNLFEHVFMKIIITFTSRQKVGYFINKDAVSEWCDKIAPLLLNSRMNER